MEYFIESYQACLEKDPPLPTTLGHLADFHTITPELNTPEKFQRRVLLVLENGGYIMLVKDQYHLTLKGEEWVKIWWSD